MGTRKVPIFTHESPSAVMLLMMLTFRPIFQTSASEHNATDPEQSALGCCDLSISVLHAAVHIPWLKNKKTLAENAKLPGFIC